MVYAHYGGSEGVQLSLWGDKANIRMIECMLGLSFYQMYDWRLTLAAVAVEPLSSVK